MVCMEDGTLYLVDFPEEGSVDQSVSFEFEAAYHKFVYNQQMKKEEKPQKEKKDDEGEDDDKKDDDEDDEDDEEVEEDGDKGPWPCNFAIMAPEGDPGKLIIGVQKEEAVFEYAGETWESPDFEQFAEDPIRNLAFYNTIAVTARYSRAGNYLLIGCEKGRLLMRQKNNLPKMFHATLMHDGMYGTILAATTSYDDAYLLTVGADGCFFVQKIDPIEPKGVAKAPKLSKKGAKKTVDDILHTDAYSIQEAKLKADEDRRRELAEMKKKSLREQVQELMREYEDLMQANEAAEKGKRISKEELSLDPEIQEILDKQNDNRVEIARKVCMFHGLGHPMYV